MPISNKDVEDRVLDEANTLESYTISDIDELEREWFSSALQEFVDGLSAKKKWLLRRRAWEMVWYSVEKHLIAEKVVADLYKELGKNPEDQTVYDSFCIAVLGSVARFEAEQHSDIDLDIIIDNDTDTNRDWIYEDCVRPGSKHIGLIRAEQAHDMRIIGFDDLDDEYTNDDYNHLIKLFQAGSWLERPNDASLDSDLDTWLNPNNLDLQELVDERYDWAEEEYREEIKEELKDRENYPTSSKFHHVVTWLSQVIAVTVGLEDESQYPYWKIVDEMDAEVPAELSRNDWNDIREAATVVMGLRPHVFPSIDDVATAKQELRSLQKIAKSQKSAFNP